VVVNVAKSDLERKLEAANADLEQAVMDAYRARKGLLDQQRKEELKAEIWHRRIRAIELERNYVGEQLMEAQHKADRAVARQDHDEYLRASRRACRASGPLPQRRRPARKAPGRWSGFFRAIDGRQLMA
jgi:hypothetical protein